MTTEVEVPKPITSTLRCVVDAKEISAVLTRIMRLLPPTRNRTPATSCVRIESDHDRLHLLLSYSNTKISLSLMVPAAVAATGVAALYLADLAKACKGKGEVLIEGGHITLNGVQCRVMQVPAETLPVLVPPPGDAEMVLYETPRSVLKEPLGSAASMMSTDDTRPGLWGVHFAPDPVGHTLLVATDGHRLCVIPCTAGMPTSGAMTLPADLVHQTNILCSTKGPTVAIYRKVTPSDRWLGLPADKRAEQDPERDITYWVRSGSSWVSAKGTAQDFPNYEQVIPGGCTATVVLNRDLTLRALTNLGARKRGGLKMAFSQDEIITFSDHMAEEGGASISVLAHEYIGKVPESIGVNGVYLMDALESFEGTQLVEMRLSDPLDPMTFVSRVNSRVCVVMPMRL